MEDPAVSGRCGADSRDQCADARGTEGGRAIVCAVGGAGRETRIDVLISVVCLELYLSNCIRRFRLIVHPCDNLVPAMSGKIDDPVDASFQAFPQEVEGLGAKFAELALSFTGLVFPPAAILKILTDQFGSANRFHRIEYLLHAFNMALKEPESQMASDRDKIRSVQTQIESPSFQEAVATAFEESARATNKEKIKHMAKILAGSLTPTRWSTKDEDVASLIRDLAQLGERDIHVLAKLSLAFGGLMLTNPTLPNRLFSDNNMALDRIVEKESDRDEFYSTCGRLIGFGLAIEVSWPINHTQPHERCIRPTRRGLARPGPNAPKRAITNTRPPPARFDPTLFRTQSESGG